MRADAPRCESCVHFVVAKLHPLSRISTELCAHPVTKGAASIGRSIGCTRERGWACGPAGRLYVRATARQGEKVPA